jgi:hypothetical protein
MLLLVLLLHPPMLCPGLLGVVNAKGVSEEVLLAAGEALAATAGEGWAAATATRQQWQL